MGGERFLVLGAGMMGRAIAYDLVRTRGKDCISVLDNDDTAVKAIEDWLDVDAQVLNIRTGEALRNHLERSNAVIVALPYDLNVPVMVQAIESGCHFCDLGGNDPIVRTQLAMDDKAREMDVLCIPDCGLAPGMANVLAVHLITEFEMVDSLTIRVGGLPQNPKPPLNYQLFFSVGGLINEYVEECKTLRGGRISLVRPMTDIESLTFEGLGELEAFNTSGGTAWLPEILEDKVQTLDYKTIRYPGHCKAMREILENGFSYEGEFASGIDQRELLESLLARSLSGDDPDVVLVRVSAEGEVDGEARGTTLEIVDRYDAENDITAMMRTTSFPTSIIIQMAVDNKIRDRGVRTPEMCVPGKDFMDELAKRDIMVKRVVEKRTAPV